jgi:4-diphosphocytidyl-2-C-methyl-D-erythritol kinase
MLFGVEPFSLPSFAKINLYLKIVGRRPDGFHDLCTIFQTVSLHDTLTFSASDEIELTCDSPEVPLGESNLVVRAVKALRDHYRVDRGASIRLEKRIPSPGGLGGGSSNAAVTLMGLCRMWDIEPPLEELEFLGSRLGSDVPFFLRGGTCLGLGRGTELYELEDTELPYLLIVTPDTAVSTPDAFAAVGAESLTTEAAKGILQICRLEAEKLDLGGADLRNDFENAVFSRFPEIAEVKGRLVELGARGVLLSGSGASVFGIFEKEETRQAAMKALDNEVNWRKFAVATVSRNSYRGALELV